MCVYVPRDSKENIVKQVAFKLCKAHYYMAVSHKDWELPNPRI